MTDYKVAITIKDGGILKQLESLQKNGIMAKMGAAGGSGGGSGGNSFMSKLQDLGQNQLLKLAGIGIGVGSLVHLMTKSSGILQSTFKLWETGMMLIFKPIGDFFGLLLRPVMLYFLSLAVPYYKEAMKFVQDVVPKIQKFFEDPETALAFLVTALTGVGTVVAAAIANKKFDLPDGGCDCTKSGAADCIRLCDTPTPSIPTPTGIPTGFPIPVPLMNPFQEAPSQTPSLFSSWNKKENELKQPQHSAVNLTEQLNIAGAGASTSVLGAKQEWGAVETASASVAVSAAAAALLWDDAVKALSGAVARISAMAGSIPNITAQGFNHFGSPTTMAVGGRKQGFGFFTTPTAADIQATADTLS